jgi:hypothetical protein
MMAKPIITEFSERHPESLENAPFFGKPHLFAFSLCRQRDVLSWKMIARHHAKVQPTSGSLRVFQAFSWL